MKTTKYCYKPKKVGYKVWVTKNRNSHKRYKQSTSTPMGIDILCMFAKELFR